MLLFKKKFLLAIRAGAKVQTIRVWQYRRMRAGQRSYIPGAGHIEIVSVDPVEIAALTDADAVPDGFETGEALRRELAALYAEQMRAGWSAYRIRFRLKTPEEVEADRQQDAAAGKKKRVRKRAAQKDQPDGGSSS